MTTRRNLLKSSLSLAAAPVGMSVAIEVAHAEDMPKWNNETDVLVLGYGNAGSNAAIAAADAGAKVLILEKTPAGGGNVSVSSGGFVVPTNKEDYYKFQKALYELSRSEWDKDLLDLFCEESLHLGDYVFTGSRRKDRCIRTRGLSEFAWRRLREQDVDAKCSRRERRRPSLRNL